MSPPFIVSTGKGHYFDPTAFFNLYLIYAGFRGFSNATGGIAS